MSSNTTPGCHVISGLSPAVDRPALLVDLEVCNRVEPHVYLSKE